MQDFLPTYRHNTSDFFSPDHSFCRPLSVILCLPLFSFSNSNTLTQIFFITVMDPLSQLPLECLHMIISLLKDQGDSSTLASLLQTNKHISFTTLPFLYSDPYQWAIHHDSKHNDINIAHKLTYLLLRQLPVDSLSTMLTFAYPDLTLQEQPTSPSLDYLRHIRHLRLERDVVEFEMNYWPRFRRNKPNSITNQDFQSQWQLDYILIGCESAKRRRSLHDCRCRMLSFHEANWALASPILDQLQSLTIPASDIDRYHHVLSRLGRLECVEIVMDAVLTRPSDVRDKFSLTNEQLGELNSRKDVIFRAITSFFKDHVALFPGQLKTAKFPDGGFWLDAPQHCPDLIQFKVFEMLPPWAGTRILTSTELLQSLAHPQSSVVGYIEEIVQREGPKRWLLRPENSRRYLQQCRSLRSLELFEVPKGIFSRAVEERRRKDIPTGDTGAINIAAGDSHRRQELVAQDLGTVLDLEIGLPPFTTVKLKDGTPTFLDDLNDLVAAVSQTLQHLTVWASTLLPLIEPRPVIYGQGWVDLPVLTHLSLDVGYCRLVIDRGLLAHCPNLTTLVLRDNTMLYDCRHLLPCLPADLPRMNKLQLQGWSAVTFDAATLHTTPNLTDLSIIMHCIYFGVQYIPPVPELELSFGILGDTTTATTTESTALAADQATTETTAPAIHRSAWTWDWHLPQLKILTLTVEFAFRFQFKMLQGCPSLHTLYLDCSSISERHVRTITISDLFSTNTAGNIDCTSSSNSSEDDQATTSSVSSTSTAPTTTRIVAPSLKKLTMFGDWVVQDSILSEFLTGMFPELEHLKVIRWSGCTLRGFVDMIRTTSRVNLSQPQPKRINKFRTLRLDFPQTSTDELFRLGMWKCESSKVGADDVPEGRPVFYLDQRNQSKYCLV